MVANYLKVAFRNLLRYKGFAAINILSLVVGILGCLVIGLFVWDERQYDKSLPGAENIYRVYEEQTDKNVITHAACVPPAFASFLDGQYPEVDTTARILMSGDKFLMEVGDKAAYEEKGLFVEASFFQIFPLTFLKGNSSTALTAPATVVISEDIARRYFGDSDPLGKLIKINKDSLTVTGVMASLPDHFHLDFRYLMSLSSAGIPAERMQRWTWHQFYTYAKLKPGTAVSALQNKFQAHVKKEIFPTLKQAGSTFLPLFQPVKEIHLKSADFVYDNAIRGNESYVNGLTIIALFVLIIACFNFVNLATARSFRRAKEIGVRKVVGAERKQLIFQFVTETVLLSVISTLLAVIAALFVVPILNAFTGKAITFHPVTNPLIGLVLIAAGVLIGILAGLYPALVLSGFQPIKVLKSTKRIDSGSSWLRPALVVLQFSLSVLLIVSTIMVYRQTKYLNNKDLGFNKDQIVYFGVRGDVKQKLETFKSELAKSPNVVSLTSGYGLPGDAFAGDGVTIATKDGEKDQKANVFIGDPDYIKTLGLKLIAGRDFSKDMTTDVTDAFIINETAVKEWGYGTPEGAIGRPMSWSEWEPLDSTKPVKRGKVIGVVQDFHYKSLHEKVTASVIQLYPQVTFTVAAKLKAAGIKSTLAYINNVWNGFAPGYPFDYKFMDEAYGKMYSSEEKLSILLWIFAVLAIVVGCMGLFGLAAFSAEQRTKEISIRKVLGAGAFNIISLLSKNFLLLIVIASAIAFPVAWWTVNSWLEDFPYRVGMSWWVFGVAVASALAIAFVAVSYQTIKAATANPVKSLRSE